MYISRSNKYINILNIISTSNMFTSNNNYKDADDYYDQRVTINIQGNLP